MGNYTNTLHELSLTLEVLNTSYLDTKYPRGVVIPEDIRNMCIGLSQHTDIPVLINGETGTGKGHLVKYIHAIREGRKNGIPCVSINCALLNSDVADSMIFGHKKGAFTGAQESSIGAVGEASNGIFFLDEIHALKLESQRKLLRLLDDGSYTRVGESTERHADFQIIVASNIDLMNAVSRGEFLIDLLMRIKGVELLLPPLRDRQIELPDIIASYFKLHDAPILVDDFRNLTKVCSFQSWPGNVRELFSALDSMRFKAAINNSQVLTPFLSSASTKSCSVESQNLVLTGTDNGDPLTDVINKVLRVKSQAIDLEGITENVEAALIKYVMNQSHSLNDVMGRLRLSRGKLDFKRRKYDLMQQCGKPAVVPAF